MAVRRIERVKPVTKKTLTIDIVTLFPGMFEGPLSESLIGRARAAGKVSIRVHNLRKWSDDPRHGKVDDRPYGGGAGMVIRPEPVYQALKELGGLRKTRSRPRVIFLSPQGRVLSQKRAGDLSRKNLILLCGHYEGIDERLMEWVDEEISIGDYVLTGGEIPALVIVDAVVRLIPGVVGDPESIKNDSFFDGILDYPHYTRPSAWRGRDVPGVLLSGNHRDIAEWRQKSAFQRTLKRRPELVGKPARRSTRKI